MLAKKTLGPDPRHKSIVEAEKGETVLTNKSRGLNNIVEMYNIGGKKHSQGGTPLDLPVDDEGTGASFIFSDKLKIKDPAVLELFGVKKKEATYADVSKKHVSIINDSKKILLDDMADDYSRTSAEKNIETSMVQLSKLKLLQESEKGFPNGIPSGTENFFKQMGVSPDELIAPNEGIEQMAAQAQQKALGGIVKKVFLPKAENGLDAALKAFGVTKEEYDKTPYIKEQVDNFVLSQNKNLNRKNQKVELAKDLNGFNPNGQNEIAQYLYIRDTLGENQDFKEALFKEYQKIQKDPSYYGKNYRGKLNTKDFSSIEIKDSNEAFKHYLDMQRRNLMMKSHDFSVAKTPHNSNAEVRAYMNQLGFPIPDNNTVTKEQIMYRAFDNLAGNQEAYDLKDVMKPFYSVKVGKDDDYFKGVNIDQSLADGFYHNTTSGQISLYKPSKENTIITPQETIKMDEVKDDKVVKGEKPQVPTEKQMLENPIGFRSQDIRNLNRALASRSGIRKYDSFMVSPEVKMADAAYFSPERAIASVMEQVNSAEDISKAFGEAQGATAGALALSGNAFSSTADIISQYADKNVGLYNNIANANSERATKQNAIDSEIRTKLHSDNVDMSEKFRRGVEMAKDKIVMMKNTAEKNMSDLYNLNRMNEQAKIDPHTGMVYITNEKDLKASSQSDVDDYVTEFKNFRNQLPRDIDDDLALRAYMGFKTGKLIPKDPDKNTQPE